MPAARASKRHLPDNAVGSQDAPHATLDSSGGRKRWKSSTLDQPLCRNLRPGGCRCKKDNPHCLAGTLLPQMDATARCGAMFATRETQCRRGVRGPTYHLVRHLAIQSPECCRMSLTHASWQDFCRIPRASGSRACGARTPGSTSTLSSQTARKTALLLIHSKICARQDL